MKLMAFVEQNFQMDSKMITFELKYNNQRYIVKQHVTNELLMNSYISQKELIENVASNAFSEMCDKAGLDIKEVGQLRARFEELVKNIGMSEFSGATTSASFSDFVNAAKKAAAEAEKLKHKLVVSEGSFYIASLDEPKNSVSTISKSLPGMETIVDCPACESRRSSLWNMVQHINDYHMWTREKIADWMDELHDSGKVNLEFDSEPIEVDKIKPPVPSQVKLPTHMHYSIPQHHPKVYHNMPFDWEDVGYTTDNFKYKMEPLTDSDFSIGPFKIETTKPKDNDVQD